MKTCATCNASHKNTIYRVWVRCGTCRVTQTGNSNWRPLGHNAELCNASASERTTG